MLKLHTIESLGKYIRKRASYRGEEIVIESIGIPGSADTCGESNSDWINISPSDGGYSTYEVYSLEEVQKVYPILKGYEQVIVPMMYEGKEIIPVEWIWNLKDHSGGQDWCIGYDIHEVPSIGYHTAPGVFQSRIQFDFGDPTPKYILKMQALNVGAIPCEESPTGYRDVWWNPCKLDEAKP